MVRSREALEDALRLLSEQDRGPRAAVLARLAITAPLAYDAEQSGQQLARALELGRGTGSLMATYAACSAQLYLTAGPADQKVPADALRELECLCRQHPQTFANSPALLELHRAIVALQQGKMSAMRSALERCAVHGREVDSRELLWHVERCGVVSRINAGHFAEAATDLESLHQRAEQDGILATEVFCAYDRSVILGKGMLQTENVSRSALALEADDPPSIWSMRVRALEAIGLHDAARAALSAVPPNRLTKLPCDRDYLGSLGALARAALAVRALDYVEVLYALLAPYPEHFAAHASFLCEGSVSQILGALAQALDRRADAITHLEAGVDLCERAGLALCKVQAQLDLARCLLGRGSGSERQRAKALERKALSEAQRIGLPRFAC
jgi:tetratricopeptide (TPR) repeat protein